MLGSSWGHGQAVILACMAAGGLVAGIAWARLASNVADRIARIVQSVLAFCYFAGYAWLIGHEQQQARLFEVFLGFGMVVWPVVWIYPPAAAYWRRRRSRARADRDDLR